MVEGTLPIAHSGARSFPQWALPAVVPEPRFTAGSCGRDFSQSSIILRTHTQDTDAHNTDEAPTTHRPHRLMRTSMQLCASKRPVQRLYTTICSTTG